MGKKKKREKNCENCFNLLPIGEGDHVCNADASKMVLDGYTPTDEYFWCGGRCWEEQ